MVEDKSSVVTEYLAQKGPATVEQIASHLGISTVMVYRKIGRLIDQGKVEKVGKNYQLKVPGPTVQSTAMPKPAEDGSTQPSTPSLPQTSQSSTDQKPEIVEASDIPFWLRWTLKSDDDANRLRGRYRYIRGITQDEYLQRRQVDKFSSETARNLARDILDGIFDNLVWILAVATIWIQQALVRVFKKQMTAQQKDFQPFLVFWLKIVILLLMGGLVGYHMHRIPQNEINITKDQLSQSEEQRKDLEQQMKAGQEEAQKSQEKINQLNQQNDQLQGQLDKTKADLSREQEQRANLEQQIKSGQSENQELQQKVSQLEQYNKAGQGENNRLQQEQQTLQQKVDYLEEQNKLGHEQSEKDRAEIERLNGVIVRNPQDKRGQLNSTVPIIPK